MKAKLLPIIKQLLFFIAVVVVVGQWQSRHLPSGVAPVSDVGTLTGENLSLTWKGQATLVYFFAPWCGVCRLSMPNLNSMQEWFPTLSVKAVAFDYENHEQVQQFANEIGVRVPIYMGDDDVRARWNITAYPTYMVIDSDGTIRAASVGYSSQFGMILRVLWTKIFS